MTRFFLSDKKLKKLRGRQRYLQDLLKGNTSHDWPIPSFANWSEEDRRSAEVAIRLRCAPEAEARAEIIEALESAHRRELLLRATGDVLPGPRSGNTIRSQAVAALLSAAPDEAVSEFADDEPSLTSLLYLLDVADLLAEDNAERPSTA